MREIAQMPVYLVDAHSDPVLIRIEGRVSFQNCACLRDFVTHMRLNGKSRFLIDFLRCASMDSTFLGVLAGLALDLRRASPRGSLVLARVGPRNLELIRNLGLHRLLTVDAGNGSADSEACNAALDCPERNELDSARLVLEAHENLVTANEANRSKFQDVLEFMKNRVDQG